MYKEGPYILSRLQNSLKNFPGEENCEISDGIIRQEYIRSTVFARFRPVSPAFSLSHRFRVVRRRRLSNTTVDNCREVVEKIKNIVKFYDRF